MAVNLFGFFRGSDKRESPKPNKFQGSPGFSITGGYVQSQETNPNLRGQQRYKTASDLLANVSIVAASVRFMLNLIAKPAWRFEPADESGEAKEYADFATDILDSIDGSWTSMVRRMALYRYHGFGLHEWQAVQREDGRIGIGKIAVRPCHTIERWDLEESGDVLGVMQRRPVDGKEQYLPRQKLIYFVDDSLTDNPEGMGWFRHLAEPCNRLQNLLRIETMGFERDLNGIPIGRAPISEINSLIGTTMPDGKVFTEAMAKAQIRGIEDFVQIETKKPGTGALLDSALYQNSGADGETYTSEKMWDLDLLTSDPKGFDAMDKAIKRLEFELALIMGTESVLIGREGEGSRALSEDKSRNLYLQGESTLADMCEVIDRDLMGAVWTLNGLPDEMKPKARTEGISFKDAEKVARVLRDMAAAGAVLAPDDPAINDLRDALDVPHAPELTPEERGIMMGTKPSPDAQLRGLAGEDEEDEDLDDPDGGGPGGKARKYDPGQPREPAGSDKGGQWTSGGDYGVTIKPYRSLHPAHANYTHAVIVDGNQYTVTSSMEEAERQAEIVRASRRAEEEANKQYNPNQPRVPKGNPDGGRWTDGDAGEGDAANDNQVLEMTKDAKRQMVEANKGKTIEEMRAEAEENQARLRKIGAEIEKAAGVDFDEPPKGFEVKTISSATRKINDEGYDGPHALTDWSRASFVVDSPAEAEAVLASLSEHGTIYDKGWKQIEEYGYLDRKVYMVHPNNGVSEIQITPRGVYQYKMGQGHQLYEIARKATTPYVIARTAARKSRRVYNRLIRDEGFEGLGK